MTYRSLNHKVDSPFEGALIVTGFVALFVALVVLMGAITAFVWNTVLIDFLKLNVARIDLIGGIVVNLAIGIVGRIFKR